MEIIEDEGDTSSRVGMSQNCRGSVSNGQRPHPVKRRTVVYKQILGKKVKKLYYFSGGCKSKIWGYLLKNIFLTIL